MREVIALLPLLVRPLGLLVFGLFAFTLYFSIFFRKVQKKRQSLFSVLEEKNLSTDKTWYAHARSLTA